MADMVRSSPSAAVGVVGVGMPALEALQQQHRKAEADDDAESRRGLKELVRASCSGTAAAERGGGTDDEEAEAEAEGVVRRRRRVDRGGEDEDGMGERSAAAVVVEDHGFKHKFWSMEEAWTLQDLVGLLPQRILNPADSIRCAAVCQVWKSSFLEDNSRVGPWLMLAERKDTDVRDFYNIINEKILNISLPESYLRNFYGTPYGWIVTVGLDLAIYLLHPLSRIRILLPAADTFFTEEAIENKIWMRMVFIRRVCLSADPTTGSCVIMAVHGQCRRLAFARIGDNTWTDIVHPYYMRFRDIIFFKGMFYAISAHRGVVVACDIESPKLEATAVAALPPRSDNLGWDFEGLYLVESCGELLVVVRSLVRIWRKTLYKPLKSYYTCNFDVYRMEQTDGKDREIKLAKVLDLGDSALFLSRSSSMSLSTKKCHGIRSNCIYFTDDDHEVFYKRRGGGDQGVFCLKDGMIERHYPGTSLSPYAPPTWITFLPFSLG